MTLSWYAHIFFRMKLFYNTIIVQINFILIENSCMFRPYIVQILRHLDSRTGHQGMQQVYLQLAQTV